jgi:hypothetical protein
MGSNAPETVGGRLSLAASLVRLDSPCKGVAIPRLLAKYHLEYLHIPALGGHRPPLPRHSYRRDGCCQPAPGETFVARPAVRIGLAPGIGEVSCVMACAALRDPARRGGRGSAHAASDQGRGRYVRPLAASRLSKPARASGGQRCVPPPPANRSAAWAPDARPHLVAAARLPKACGSRGSPARQLDGGVGTAGGQACEIGS